ncbi:hypothetical protein WBG78_25045 [Chryseolinea sp. T2]|uniref:tetratricopeptide repeat protein n=1 Tax=Chryseolinea sp. T2 TaxID=3129255 RepID=UPI0030781D37
MEKGKTTDASRQPVRYNRNRTKRAVDIRELRAMFRDFADNEEWDEVIKTIQPMLMSRPRDHWLLTQGALAYYQKKDYSGALVYAAEALTIEFACPLAQFIFANALAGLGETKDALEFLEPLIGKGVRHITHSRCGEGSDCNINTSRAIILITEARRVVSLAMPEMGNLLRWPAH